MVLQTSVKTTKDNSWATKTFETKFHSLIFSPQFTRVWASLIHCYPNYSSVFPCKLGLLFSNNQQNISLLSDLELLLRFYDCLMPMKLIWINSCTSELYRCGKLGFPLQRKVHDFWCLFVEPLLSSTPDLHYFKSCHSLHFIRPTQKNVKLNSPWFATVKVKKQPPNKKRRNMKGSIGQRRRAIFRILARKNVFNPLSR